MISLSTVASVLRSNQAYCAQICERHTLDWGIAYFSTRFAGLPEANQLREVVIPKEESIPQAYAAAESFFESKALTCARWAPAEGTASKALDAFMRSQGFREHTEDVLVLRHWVRADPDSAIRIVPARAMRGAFEATFADSTSVEAAAAADLLRNASVERLDDPSLDMFVAVSAGRPVGRCALYQVGDIGRVVGPFTPPGAAEERVRRVLLAHVLALAQRLAMRIICAAVPSADPAAPAFLALGFERDGQIVEYHRMINGSDS